MSERQGMLIVQKQTVCTAIFHCFYRKPQTNSSNKIKFTDITLRLPLQREFHENVVKGDLKVDIFITCHVLFFVQVLC